MQINYYVISVIILSFILLLARFILQRKKNIPVSLFAEALRIENSGHFEEAIVTYQNALNEVKKNRFHSTLEDRIIEKLKVLHTTIEYNNNLRFVWMG
jgi:hypothetical protein